MTTKEQQIEKYLAEPIKVGDSVYVKGLGTQDKTKYFYTVIVQKLDEEKIYYEYHGYNELQSSLLSDCKKSTISIGHNPFESKPWNSTLRMVNFGLDSILSRLGYESRKKEFKSETFGNVIIPELNWTPIIKDSDGNEVCYQRDFIWTLKDKQLLIESIYNSIDIGKIIVRRRSWSYVENRVKKNLIQNTAFYDIVDGKQRLNAIFGFITNEFPDINGYYFSDLSELSQRKFEGFQQLAYGEIEENATDEDVLKIFLNVNFAGVAMSQEHIDFVKSIKVK